MPNLNVGLSLALGIAVDANAMVEDEFVDIKIWFDNEYTNGFGSWSAIYTVKDCSGEDYSSSCYWGGSFIECLGIPIQSTITVQDQYASSDPDDMNSTVYIFEYCTKYSGEESFYIPTSYELNRGLADAPDTGGSCNCGSTGGGGSSGSSWCSRNCLTGPWTTYGNGVEYRSVCDYCYSSSNYSRSTQYRCGEGYFGVAKDDMSGCMECPAGACCGTLVDEAGEPIDYEAYVFVSKTATSCHPYMLQPGAPNLIITDCSLYDSWYLSLGTIGYVRTEMALSESTCDKSDPYADISTNCKTDFRLEVIADDGLVSCADTQYRDYSSGKTVCKTCPAYNGITGVTSNNSSGSWGTREVDCAIPKTQTFSDTIGTFKYADGCKMCTADL